MYRSFGTECLEFLPTMNDGIGIDFCNALQNSVAKFFPGFHADMPKKRACHLSEESLDDVEPRSMSRRQHILEAVGSGCQERPRLFRDMRGMIVENDPDRALRRIIGVQIFEQSDELATPVTALNPPNDMAVM